VRIAGIKVTNRKNMDELRKELVKVLFEKYLKKKI
jgi:hypothetical protein